MHDANQDLYDALHGIQLWGIVGQTRDPLLGKGRAGSNDEFLAAYKRLEERVDAIVDENAKLRDLVHDVWAYYVSGTLHPCELCDRMLDCENHPALSCKRDGDSGFVDEAFEGRMRELRIEVE